MESLLENLKKCIKKFDDPWRQLEEAERSYIRSATCLTLKKYHISSLVEVGCGLGKTTNYLATNTRNVDILGIDISDTAEKKKKNHIRI